MTKKGSYKGVCPPYCSDTFRNDRERYYQSRARHFLRGDHELLILANLLFKVIYLLKKN